MAEAQGINDPAQSFSCGWADYDNDGDLDLYVSNGSSAIDKLYENFGFMFADVTSTSGIAGNQHTGSFTWGDFNNDGFLDLYLSNNGSVNNLYISNAGNSNNWIILKMKGVESNWSAIGTRVRIVVNGQAQIREVQGGSGHNGQHSLPLEFGIGEATIIDTVVVKWPSGLEQIFTELIPNQILSLTEGSVFTGTHQITSRLTSVYLQPNYPNPFSKLTNIPFQIPQAAYVKLVICNQLNQEITVLVDQNLPLGSHTIRWDAVGFKAGVYFCRLMVGNDIVVEKLILVD